MTKNDASCTNTSRSYLTLSMSNIASSINISFQNASLKFNQFPVPVRDILLYIVKGGIFLISFGLEFSWIVDLW